MLCTLAPPPPLSGRSSCPPRGTAGRTPPSSTSSPPRPVIAPSPCSCVAPTTKLGLPIPDSSALRESARRTYTAHQGLAGRGRASGGIVLYLDRLAPYELRRYRRCLAVSARQYAVRDESRPGREDDSVGQVCVSAEKDEAPGEDAAARGDDRKQKEGSGDGFPPCREGRGGTAGRGGGDHLVRQSCRGKVTLQDQTFALDSFVTQRDHNARKCLFGAQRRGFFLAFSWRAPDVRPPQFTTDNCRRRRLNARQYWHLASAARSGFACPVPSRRVGRRASVMTRLPARPSASVAFYVRRALRTVASLPKPRPRLGLAPEGRVIAKGSQPTAWCRLAWYEVIIILNQILSGFFGRRNSANNRSFETGRVRRKLLQYHPITLPEPYCDRAMISASIIGRRGDENLRII
ncbi:hypothetical protein THAOC_37670 [Thalassiosira oceanica]|uniref:Uncharacterized protein n=1 Tax=Thalassiosira oceanica TaxID=159749 RepID=K0QYJ0_THAOC|nr:hypothetical protein THAOC_37670 [Thalassiosira oceanica]|eukprot:EJK43845.1 hypothetical protein THAOC_37670 [Thalassiosira oceanica]